MSYLVDYVPASQRGVAYFSSVPHDMRPPEVCLHFNQFGTILRHRFVPYPKRERRPGGPLIPLQYKEGWIEYSTVADAEAAAAHMNGQPVKCKRGRKCYGQLWAVKFMPAYTWDTLVEEREGERRSRRAAEVDAKRQEKDANEAYRRIVMQSQQAKRKRRAEAKEDGSMDTAGDADIKMSDATGTSGSSSNPGKKRGRDPTDSGADDGERTTKRKREKASDGAPPVKKAKKVESADSPKSPKKPPMKTKKAARKV